MSVLKIGDKAPEFELLNQDGIKIALKDFLGKKVLLYFYPKDNTPGCTTQACDFTQFYEEFTDKNYAIIGISPDDTKSHEKFAQKFKLKHILLSDTQKEVCKKYGAWGVKKNYGKEYEGLIRSSFIIDEKGIIKELYYNVKAKGHVQKLLERI